MTCEYRTCHLADSVHFSINSILFNPTWRRMQRSMPIISLGRSIPFRGERIKWSSNDTAANSSCRGWAITGSGSRASRSVTLTAIPYSKLSDQYRPIDIARRGEAAMVRLLKLHPSPSQSIYIPYEAASLYDRTARLHCRSAVNRLMNDCLYARGYCLQRRRRLSAFTADVDVERTRDDGTAPEASRHIPYGGSSSNSLQLLDL